MSINIEQKTLNFLVVDDDSLLASILERALKRRGFSVATASDKTSAINLAQTVLFDKAIIDLKLGSDSGLQLIHKLLELQPQLHIVMLTGYSSISTAVEAIKLGAVNYLCKPADADEILAAFNAQTTDAATTDYTPISVERLEWEHIQKVLQENQGNISATARSLGMHRRTLQRKLHKRPVRQ
jgi:two-component system, response regulator RegA